MPQGTGGEKTVRREGEVELMEKHYCEKCGAPLKTFITTHEAGGYDVDTGRKKIFCRCHWKCPNARWWNMLSGGFGHTDISYHTTDFYDALNASKYRME